MTDAGTSRMDRRMFLAGCFGASAGFARAAEAGEPVSRTFVTRGVVLVPEDFTLEDWPERAKRAGLTTLALHPFPGVVTQWIQSDAGRRFLDKCRALGLEVEYELHAIRELLPRKLFKEAPEMFRMDEKGQRTPDANCCVHSARGLEIIAGNAVETAKVLRPTTGRYFYWGDDVRPWCQCPKCRGLSPADQSLIVENRICQTLRQTNPTAQVAHLAYSNTLWPPKEVKPVEGVFLEYAPIRRRYDMPYEQQQQPGDRDSLAALDANLKVFPKDTAQALEYWLDVSLFSRQARVKRPGVKLPWNKQVFQADLETYRKRGIRHITTFAVYIDADYAKKYGDLGFIAEYGAGLLR